LAQLRKGRARRVDQVHQIDRDPRREPVAQAHPLVREDINSAMQLFSPAGLFQFLPGNHRFRSTCTGWVHLFTVAATFAVATHAHSGTDSTKPDKSKAARPEPIVFDLVQSLGASRGETEVNTLMSFSPRTGEVDWSPEIEYAFADGYGIELELPFQDSYLDKYKVSLQGTIGTLIKERMIHGWQAIGKRVNSDKTYEADFLYLNDIRLSKNWSMMYMVGIRLRGIGKRGNGPAEAVPLVNNSVFYRFSDYFTVGCELNNEIHSNGWRYRVTPQMQYIFNKHNIVQLGGGPSRLDERKKTDWLFSARVIYSF
jgi:hypothetical protein